MSKQRIIRDEIWRDSWFYNLTPEQKVVWVYLLTNPDANVAGLYKLNTTVASTEVGLSKEALEGALSTFEGDKKIARYHDWLFLINFYKHQSKSPKITAGIKRILSEVPIDVIQYVYGIDRVPEGYRTLLNFTLLNLTSLNGGADFPDELFDKKKFSDKDMQMAQLLADLIKRNNPDWQLRGKMETWAEHIEKLHRIDGRTYQQIEYMIRWTQANDFWQQNILSTAKLREKFNDLIPKLKADLQRQHTRQQEASKPKMLWNIKQVTKTIKEIVYAGCYAFGLYTTGYTYTVKTRCTEFVGCVGESKANTIITNYE